MKADQVYRIVEEDFDDVMTPCDVITKGEVFYNAQIRTVSEDHMEIVIRNDLTVVQFDDIIGITALEMDEPQIFHNGTVSEMIEMLQEMVDDDETVGDYRVIFAHQPSYPLYFQSGKVAIVPDSRRIVIAQDENGSSDYLPGAAAKALGWKGGFTTTF